MALLHVVFQDFPNDLAADRLGDALDVQLLRQARFAQVLQRRGLPFLDEPLEHGYFFLDPFQSLQLAFPVSVHRRLGRAEFAPLLEHDIDHVEAAGREGLLEAGQAKLFRSLGRQPFVDDQDADLRAFLVDIQ